MNPEQKKAVETTSGRLLILAGAGSGKTRVIVHRIAYLIHEKKISPESILALTFTNKAAKEMRERLSLLVGKELSKKVTLSTFHSFAMKILRKEIERLGYTKEFSLYDEHDLNRLIQQITRDILQLQGELPSLAKTKEALKLASHLGEAPEGPLWHDSFTKELYEKLQSTLRAHNALSFDHLLELTVKLFEEHPDILDRYQEQFRYIMIDEYQDTNPIQLRLAEQLAAKYKNLCVVGDDDQSIYAFRGAEAKAILGFQSDHLIKLEENFRSTPSILQAANAVIAHNKTRHGKNLWTKEQKGEPLELFHAPSDIEEANAVVQRMLILREEKGLKWKDMAILYRSNALSRQLEIALMQASYQKEGQWVRGIPYEVFGGTEFAERSEIKDLFAYLRFLANPLDEEALLRIINVPRRGISDHFLDLLTQENRQEKKPLWELIEKIANKEKQYPQHPKGMQGIYQFYHLIEKAKKRFANQSLSQSLIWFLEEIHYKKAIEEEVKSEKMRLFKWENVQECVNGLAQYEEERKEEASLQDYISQTILGKPNFTEEKRSSEDRVQLMTFHSSKGLEFPACFLVALEDHILPHEKSCSKHSDIEEERRLFYVAITRARKYLTLSMAQCRMKMGKPFPTTPSRFLHEIPKHLLKLTRYTQVN